MGKMNISNIVKSVRSSMKKHSPEILTGIGIAGMITTTVMAVRVTPKALLYLDWEKERENVDKLTPLETVKTVWKCYIPPAVIGGMSIACLVGASSVNLRRNTALTAAYALSETALRDYRDKVIETIGEEKEQAVRDAIIKDKIEQNPVTDREVIITGKGETLCFDTLSGRYFYSDVDKLRKAAVSLSRQMLDEGYVSLNDFYYEIGLRGTKLGQELGWNIYYGLIDLKFSPQMSEEEKPCLAIDYEVPPRYHFDTRM